MWSWCLLLLTVRFYHQMGESMKVALRDALKMVGIEPEVSNSEVPQASWDLYEMIQACMQVMSLSYFVLEKISKIVKCRIFLVYI